MSSKPRILCIDDIYGSVRDGRSIDREDFCVQAGLRDITGDVAPEIIPDVIAEVQFCRGQVERAEVLENDLEGTLEIVRKGWQQWPRWSLILLDLHFKTGHIDDPIGRAGDRDPGKYFGLAILEHLWDDPDLSDIPVVILSAMERDIIERRFATRGVWDFVDKNKLNRAKLNQLLRNYGLLEDEKIIGHSVPLLKCLREARSRAQMGNDNILILGERGTGKELIASYIYRQSGRAGSYVPLYIQGVPENLIEDRLFGHTRGAYTNARDSRAGLAELADEGTLFIDEFGDIPSTIQAKLLRLLDKNIRETQRIGDTEVRRLDLQVIMATERDIVSGEDFRRSLLDRAQVFNAIFLPPLRERAEDIPLLANHFVSKFEREFNAEPRTISDEALEALINYSWPGNIRGLEGVIENAVFKYRNLRSLEKNHFDLKPEVKASTASHSVSSSLIQQPPEKIAQEVSAERDLIIKLQDILDYLRRARIDKSDPDLYGIRPALEETFMDLMRHIAGAALEISDPRSGRLNRQAAMQMLSGDDKLKGKGPARVLNSILGRRQDEAITEEDLQKLNEFWQNGTQKFQT